jgi:hypothetical protein
MLNVGLLAWLNIIERALPLETMVAVQLIETVGGDFLARQICLRVS